MAVDKAEIKSQISEMMSDLLGEEDPSDIPSVFADKLSSIIRDAILSATITVPSGIPVSTVGSATAQTGTTTSPATATIA